MSTNYFHLLLLSLALHACHARNLGIVDEQFSGKKLQISPQIERNLSNSEDSSMPRRMNNERNTATSNEKNKISAGAQLTRAANSVSSSLPREKEHQENPEFGLDYESPKTHPPCHN